MVQAKLPSLPEAFQNLSLFVSVGSRSRGIGQLGFSFGIIWKQSSPNNSDTSRNNLERVYVVSLTALGATTEKGIEA